MEKSRIKDKPFALVQDNGKNMYYLAYTSAIKSLEGIKVIEHYINQKDAISDLIAYSTGKKKGELAPTLTLKELFNLIKEDEKIKGGLGDYKADSDFDKKQLEKGIQHELEHTKDLQVAKEIAKDHLIVDKNYYKKLEKMEKGK